MEDNYCQEENKKNKPLNPVLKRFFNLFMFLVIFGLSVVLSIVYMFSRPRPSTDPMIQIPVDLSAPGIYSGELVVDDSQNLCRSKVELLVKMDVSSEILKSVNEQLPDSGIVIKISNNSEPLFELEDFTLGWSIYSAIEDEPLYALRLDYDHTLHTREDLTPGSYSLSLIVNKGIPVLSDVKQKFLIKPFYCRTCYAFMYSGNALLIFIFLLSLFLYLWFAKIDKKLFPQ